MDYQKLFFTISSCWQKQLEFKDLNWDLRDGLVGIMGPKLREPGIFLQGSHRGSQPVLLVSFPGAFPSIEEIPENVVHDHEKNGLPRLSSFSDAEIQKR